MQIYINFILIIIFAIVIFKVLALAIYKMHLVRSI